MRRVQVFPGALPLETDILNTNKGAFIALGHILQDMLGTGTLFSGLGCVPTSPAGMTVNVNPGRAYSYQATDTGAYSSLAADPHMLVKQGILLDAVNFSCPAPTTAGFSQNYLIEGAFQEIDAGSTVLPYYNAANPAVAFSGPNGTGTSNTTYRDNTVQLQVKAGSAAATGSQTTPTPDSGFTGLWVVTVAFGATTITSGNVTQYSGAPFLSANLLTLIQACALLNGSTSQVFNVAPASSPTNALQQQQKGYLRSTSNSSLVVPPGVTQILLSASAGGGGAGSGGSGSGGTTGVGGGGGGGGAGQSLNRVPFAVTPGSTISWTIGALGAGGAASASGGGNAGAAGGATVISGLTAGTQTLTGGGAGAGGGNGTGTGPGGSGGAGSPAGSYGIDGSATVAGGSFGGGAAGGVGGSSPFGGGGGAGRGATSTGVAGLPAGGFGSGGGGGGGPYGGAGGVGAAGGAGAAGFVLIEW